MKLKFKFIIMSIILVQLFSCAPDDDTNPTSNDIRDKIATTWKCQENSTSFGQQNYYVEIIKDTLANKIYIDNFFNLGLGKKVHATVSGQNIIINNQTIDGYLFNGNGVIAGNYNSINWTYTFDEGNGPEQVTALYTKM